MKLIESKPISFSEVRGFLKERKSETPGGELGYEQANTLEYVEKFVQLSEAKEKSLRDDIEKIAAIPDSAVVQLVDLLPRKEDEIKLILASAKFDLPDDKIKDIAKLTKKHRKS